MIKFLLSAHAITKEPMVEVWRDDTFVASIYRHEEGVRLVSKYFDGVAYDTGSPPAVVIKLRKALAEALNVAETEPLPEKSRHGKDHG